MHRLAAIPGSSQPGDPQSFIEQPPAPVVLLSSADTDLATVSTVLQDHPGVLDAELRALNLAALHHPALIDHYLRTSLVSTRLVVVRLLGGRGHWSYGLEALQRWSQEAPDRLLLVLAGTADEEHNLADLSSVPAPLAIGLARCFREGGPENIRRVLSSLRELLVTGSSLPPQPQPLHDPHPHDWRPEAGARVGVVLYRAWWQAGDLELATALLTALREAGLAPRALWVTSLRELPVQAGVRDLLQREAVQAVICTTAFASVQFEEAGLGSPLWESLGVPVLQLLCSGQPRTQWETSCVGLGPIDLSLQVVLPELDGRITTRVGAFKELRHADARLATAVLHLVPDRERLSWVAALTRAWVELRQTPVGQRRLGLVLANYPTRNSRLANGVGLDTPASTVAMLHWLREAGYDLGDGDPTDLPSDGDALIAHLLKGLTNDPESGHRPALTHLPLANYQRWYATLPEESRGPLEARWGPPERDAGIEHLPSGEPAFPIRGLAFGAVVVLIQPERGYSRDPALSYHSPDLPPTHAYLAQYLWLRQGHGAQALVHVGKHGNLEWLPGKGVGLSAACYPEWALGPVPHLYPFIVNDPGEGSQAKRRAQAVILDHLTPPLGRAGLHGELQELEVLLDEYWDACQLGSARLAGLRRRLDQRLQSLALPLQGRDPEERLQAADGYLCELKEAQIRLGLHTYGSLPERRRLAELLLCLARPPQAGHPGLTQAFAIQLGLRLDPWADPDEQPLSPEDRAILLALRYASPPQPATPIAAPDPPGEAAEEATERLPHRLDHCGDAVAWLEHWTLAALQPLVDQALGETPDPEAPAMPEAALPRPPADSLQQVAHALLPRLLACGDAEQRAFLVGLDGGRIAPGPSGAPTRGRPDLLPTGRNFYSVDLRGLPTEAAWDLGRRSAELLLDLHLQEHGEDLRHLALSVWGTATMRNGGEDIAQALALLGVRPVWDGPTRRMVDLEVIPLSLLGRPRVDVTLRISGLFRDAFPQLVGWMHEATTRVAALEESAHENPLAAAARTEGHAARVYGSAPGAYGAGLQGLIDSGDWEHRDDLGEAYLQWSAWRYEGSDRITSDRDGLEQRLRQVQVVLHNQDNREHDLLDSDDYYQFQGGLSAAIERVSGKAPDLWFGDHSRQQRPRVHRLEREFDKVLRSRVLNPRWIRAMSEHGYKGGFEMAATLDYLFAYDASTDRVPDWSYGAIQRSWLGNQEVLHVLRQSNPWALRDMAERLLEAHNRGLWQGASSTDLEDLRHLVLDTDLRLEKP
ncbi:MAG: cobaltochelatase subunit CobN [Cyanobacteriota bacterium]